MCLCQKYGYKPNYTLFPCNNTNIWMDAYASSFGGVPLFGGGVSPCSCGAAFL